jgi:hypothetical protein
VQLNVPVISRDYTRVLASGVKDGNVTGFGDLSLLAIAKVFTWTGLDKIVHVDAFAGVKLPTAASFSGRGARPALRPLPRSDLLRRTPGHPAPALRPSRQRPAERRARTRPHARLRVG